MIQSKRNFIITWFDGASQLNGQISGVGGVFKTLDLIVYKWIFNCGRGTNNRVELLGVWATLRLALHLSFLGLQFLGDSKVVIDWLFDRARLQSSTIEGWNDRIKELIKSFIDISFGHVYREYNVEVDQLSKMSLKEPEDRITYSQWTNGVEGPKLFLSLY
jgi:ribonuclease HI